LHIIIGQQKFAEALQIVQRAVATRTTLPALTGILLHAEGGDLTLRGTDLDLSLECTVEARVEQPGSVVVPARYLVDIVKRISGGDLAVQVSGEGFTTTLFWGRSQVQLHGMNPEQFPEEEVKPSRRAFSLPAKLLKHLIASTSFAVSHDETRPALTGQLLEIAADRVDLVATDGFRLAFRQARLSEGPEEDVAIVIPGRTLNELARLLPDQTEETVQVSIGEGTVACYVGGIVLRSRLIQARYPEYRAVIPSNFQTQVRLDKRALYDACERAWLLSRDKDNAIKLQVRTDSVRVFAHEPDLGSVDEELTAEVDGEELDIAFNAQFLIDALGAVDSDEVLFEATGPGSAARVRSPLHEDYYCIVLPMKVIM